MTNKEHLQNEGRSSKNLHPQDKEKRFEVVLIDLEKAAKEKRIHCVKKLSTASEDLKYVAISYRWGEVQETTLDTGVGYLAMITSFGLNDFFHLCHMISKEVDLQHMDYVWVDAICVNQTSSAERKAAVYHMTDIYERANYILSVPDLHLKYLKESSTNEENTIRGSFKHREYIYHLIQGNIEKLFELDQQWLDSIGVYKDNQRLRHLLTHYTEHFTTGLVMCRKMNHYCHDYYQKATLQHIYETSNNTTNDDDSGHDKVILVVDKTPVGGNDKHLDTLATISKLHTCDNVNLCPFNKLFNEDCNNDDYQTNDLKWMQQIPERSQEVRQSVIYLKDLVMDWSSRAWVVSEYHIAKNKSNKKMKYWFIQLGDAFRFYTQRVSPRGFFTFDFNTPFFSTCNADDGPTLCHVPGTAVHVPQNIYQCFHSTMRQQLNQLTFLEKMLKTKASRHEDRFHAILPASEYKSILDNKDIVNRWHHISTLVSVKLELFKWMSTKHKLELLFLAGGDINTCQVPPTFATTNLDWKIYSALTAMDDTTFPFPCNFDLTTSPSTATSTIQLLPLDDDDDHSRPSFKLNIKPREYYLLLDTYLIHRYYLTKKDIVNSKLLALNLTIDEDCLDFIVIPGFRKQAKEENDDDNDCSDYNEKLSTSVNIVLIGCMAKNKWVLMHFNIDVKRRFTWMRLTNMDHRYWKFCQCDENDPGFDIY